MAILDMMTRNGRLLLTGLLFLAVPGWVVAVEGGAPQPPLSVLSVQSRQAWPDDPGRLEAYVRNIGDSAVRIPQMLADGKSMEEAPLVLWHAIAPEELQPGETGQLTARSWNGRPQTLTVECEQEGKGFSIPITLPEGEADYAVSGARLAHDGRRIYMYVSRHSGPPERILNVETLAGPKCRVSSILNGDFSRGDLACLVLQPDGPVAEGSRLFVQIAFAGGGRIFANTRVFSTFPVTLDEYGPFIGLGMDDAPAAPPFLPLPSDCFQTPGGVAVFSCPAHTGKSRKDAAETALERARLIESNPAAHDQATIIHVCRVDVLATMRQFGGVADIMRVNIMCPFFPRNPFFMEAAPNYHPCQYLGDTAEAASAPDNWQAVIPVAEVEVMPHAQVLRLAAAYALSSGAKGLLYRGQPMEDIRDSLAEMNKQLQSIKEYLSIAEPAQLASCNAENVEARCLLAGDKGVVIFLIQHAKEEHSERGRRRIIQLKPGASAVKVDVTLPEGMAIAKITEVSGNGRPVDSTLTGDGVTFSSPETPVLAVYLLTAAAP